MNYWPFFKHVQAGKILEVLLDEPMLTSTFLHLGFVI